MKQARTQTTETAQHFPKLGNFNAMLLFDMNVMIQYLNHQLCPVLLHSYSLIMRLLLSFYFEKAKSLHKSK